MRVNKRVHNVAKQYINCMKVVHPQSSQIESQANQLVPSGNDQEKDTLTFHIFGTHNILLKDLWKWYSFLVTMIHIEICDPWSSVIENVNVLTQLCKWIKDQVPNDHHFQVISMGFFVYFWHFICHLPVALTKFGAGLLSEMPWNSIDSMGNKSWFIPWLAQHHTLRSKSLFGHI